MNCLHYFIILSTRMLSWGVWLGKTKTVCAKSPSRRDKRYRTNIWPSKALLWGRWFNLLVCKYVPSICNVTNDKKHLVHAHARVFWNLRASGILCFQQLWNLGVCNVREENEKNWVVPFTCLFWNLMTSRIMCERQSWGLGVSYVREKVRSLLLATHKLFSETS